MSILTVENLFVGYGSGDVLQDLSLSTGRAGVCAVVGAEGSGKTTLVRSVTGQITRRGRILFDGKLISTMEPREIAHLGIATVPQGSSISAELSVEDNLLLGGYMLGDRSRLKKRIAAVYQQFPILQQHAQEAALNLDSHQQVLLAFARAMLAEPRLMLLDEPSAGLDPSEVAELFGTIVRYAQAHAVKLIVLERDLPPVFAIAEKIFVLAQGRIVAAGNVEQFRRHTSLEDIMLIDPG